MKQACPCRPREDHLPSCATRYYYTHARVYHLGRRYVNLKPLLFQIYKMECNPLSAKSCLLSYTQNTTRKVRAKTGRFVTSHVTSFFNHDPFVLGIPPNTNQMFVMVLAVLIHCFHAIS